MDKPDVDYIEGLSPAISIDQKRQVIILVLQWEQLPRFMIICVYYSLEWENLIVQKCGKPITQQTVDQW